MKKTLFLFFALLFILPAFAEDNLHVGWSDEYRTYGGLTFHRNFTDDDPTGSTLTLIAASSNNGEVHGYVTDYGQAVSPFFPPEGSTELFRQKGPEEYTATSYVIPSAVDGMPVVKMNYDAFQGNKIIKSITFPEENLIDIPFGAFSDCTSLETLNFGGTSIKTIGTDAFAGCVSLREIVDWGNVEVIGSSYNNTGAFRNCTSLTALAIGPSVKEIHGCAFNGCSNLTYLAFADTDKELCFADAIESQFSGCPITTVYIGRPFANNCVDGYYRFKSPLTGLTTITDVILGPSIKTIRNTMFAAWKSTGTVHAPEVTTIGTYAFYQSNMAFDAPKLKVLEEGALKEYKRGELNLYNVEIIGTEALAEPQFTMTSLTLPASVRQVNYNAFNKWNELTSLTIANSDEPIILGYYPSYEDKIGTDDEFMLYNGPWLNAPKLQELYVGRPLAHEDLIIAADENGRVPANPYGSGSSVLLKVTLQRATWLPSRAFENKKSLIEASMPMLDAVPRSCFSSCTKLTSVDAPNIKSIGYMAFASSGLKEFTITPSVTLVDERAFDSCTDLKKLSIEYSETPLLTDYSSAYQGYSYSSFVNGTGLETLYIDRDLEMIHPNYAKRLSFNKNNTPSLKTVIIGENVKSLAGYAFNVLTMDAFRCRSKVPVELETYIFNEQERGYFVTTDVQKKVKLVVPTAALDAYRAAPLWRGFLSILSNGDINNDGTVNVGDVALVYQCLLDESQENRDFADINGDGNINSGDISSLYEIILNSEF